MFIVLPFKTKQNTVSYVDLFLTVIISVLDETITCQV